MKRFLVLFVALSFLFCGSVFAAEATKMGPAAAAKEVAKETTMSATGKVTEITETMLKIERTVKGKTEVMEVVLEKTCPVKVGKTQTPWSQIFATKLEKNCPKIEVGDKVTVSYVTKDDKNVATKVTKKAAKKAAKKATKKAAAKEAKPAEEKAAPATK